MSATMELDPLLKQALKLLHSSSCDSAEKIRISLDEVIKQRYGSRKMLINTLSRKYLDEESSSPGTTTKRRKSSESKGSGSSKKTPPAPEVMTAIESVSIAMNVGDVSEEENLKEFGDLACVVCDAMVVKAGNRLIECADCHSLYHQECHKPHISDDDANEQEYSWCCTDCKNKVMMAKSSTSISIPSPSKSSSSSSSSSYTSHYTKTYEPSSTTKHKSSSSKISSSTSKSSFGNLASSSNSLSSNAGNSSNSKTSSTSSSSSSVTPSINIISADQRLQIMKKKAAKQLESKRKHK